MKEFASTSKSFKYSGHTNNNNNNDMDYLIMK